MKKYTFTLSLFIVCSLFLAYLFKDEIACKQKQGLWASNGEYCISQDCYLDNSCGLRANPFLQCNQLKAGDGIAKAYFLLGTPATTNNTLLTWYAFKAEEALITIETTNNQIKTITCPMVKGQ